MSEWRNVDVAMALADCGGSLRMDQEPWEVHELYDRHQGHGCLSWMLADDAMGSHAYCLERCWCLTKKNEADARRAGRGEKR